MNHNETVEYDGDEYRLIPGEDEPQLERHETHCKLDQLAVEIEQTISDGEAFLEGLPEFAPRSDRSKKMGRVIKNNKQSNE